MSLAELLGVPPERLTAVVTNLKRAHMTVAVSESLTAGLTAALLTEVPGSSAVVRGGFIVYATDLKNTLGGVDPNLLADRGAVDPDVAKQLALGARKRCRADFGLGLTGAAGPDPQDGHEPGTVFVAIAGPDSRGGVATIVRALELTGSRAEIRAAAVREAVDLLDSLVTIAGNRLAIPGVK
ncbi:CinA family protein [Nakamurella silvestris]|nr:CinA family protein [Nakamurella silvestris]